MTMTLTITFTMTMTPKCLTMTVTLTLTPRRHLNELNDLSRLLLAGVLEIGWVVVVSALPIEARLGLG